MSVELERVGWEDGTLVTPARVEVGGVTYDVTDAEYSGTTPLSAQNLKKMENNFETFVLSVLEAIFPIGSTYTTQANINPSTILGFGTWERLQARLPIGIDDNDSSYQTIGATGGTKTTTLSYWNMPNGVVWNQSGSISVGSGSQKLGSKTDAPSAFSNMPPYKIVGYMWLRTA